jgi:hypothetical protein
MLLRLMRRLFPRGASMAALPDGARRDEPITRPDAKGDCNTLSEVLLGLIFYVEAISIPSVTA